MNEINNQNQLEKTLTIESIKRIHGRAVIMLSNGEELIMPRAMLKERPYKCSMPFDRMSFDAFLRDRAFSFAMEKAVSLLASRSRTEKEIIDALRRNAYPESAVARVMQRLSEAGYVDDKDFAQQWASSRTTKGMGVRRIRAELKMKGISQAEIDEVLEKLDSDEMISGAVKVAQKASRGKNLSSPIDRQKVMAALARRGYDYSIAREALRRITNG